MDSFEILSPHQHGYRKHKSTIDAVTRLVEAVTEALEGGGYTVGVFLDLSKAND